MSLPTLALGVWLAAFWTLMFVRPLAAVCLWLALLLFFLVQRLVIR
jgi:hypothetical protein